MVHPFILIITEPEKNSSFIKTLPIWSEQVFSWSDVGFQIKREKCIVKNLKLNITRLKFVHINKTNIWSWIENFCFSFFLNQTNRNPLFKRFIQWNPLLLMNKNKSIKEAFCCFRFDKKMRWNEYVKSHHTIIQFNIGFKIYSVWTEWTVFQNTVTWKLKLKNLNASSLIFYWTFNITWTEIIFFMIKLFEFWSFK